jgi:hypothetical protein
MTGLSAPVPSDFYDYLEPSEKNLPIEDRLRLYKLRKVVGDKKILSLPEIYKRLVSILQTYIDTTPENLMLLSLWTIGARYHSEFNTFPLLHALAQKGAGKSRTLRLVSSIIGNGSCELSLTEAYLFRRPCTPAFFDELESIDSREKANLRELLNSAYKKGTEIIRYYKAFDGKQKEERFSPYYPIMIANINGLNEVLADRAIQVVLRKSHKAQTLLIEDFAENVEIKNLRSQLWDLNKIMTKDFF